MGPLLALALLPNVTPGELPSHSLEQLASSRFSRHDRRERAALAPNEKAARVLDHLGTPTKRAEHRGTDFCLFPQTHLPSGLRRARRRQLAPCIQQNVIDAITIACSGSLQHRGERRCVRAREEILALRRELVDVSWLPDATTFHFVLHEPRALKPGQVRSNGIARYGKALGQLDRR